MRANLGVRTMVLTLTLFFIVLTTTSVFAESSEQAVAVTDSLIIELIGPNPQIIEAGSKYEELGATTLNNNGETVDANITIDSNTVNTSKVGLYSVIYNAMNANDNNAKTVTRIVSVEDTLAPTTIASTANGYTFGSWTNKSKVIVNLGCNDKASGCASKIRYCVDTENKCVPAENNLSAICSPDQTMAKVGTQVVWTVVPSDSAQTYSYEWSGDFEGKTAPITTSSPSLIVDGYSLPGQKNVGVTITSEGRKATAKCSTEIFTDTDTPTCSFTAAKSNPVYGHPVIFNSIKAFDPSTGMPITMGIMDFGDGQTANVWTGMPITHTYPNPETAEATYTATLTVTNEEGLDGNCSAPVTILLNEPPVLTCVLVTSASAYNDSESVAFTATDISGQPLPKTVTGNIYFYPLRNDNSADLENSASDSWISDTIDGPNTHTFSNPGSSDINYQISLNIRDSNAPGILTMCYKQITIKPAQTTTADNASNSQPARASQAVTVSTNGISYLRFYSTDNLGNTEAIQNKKIMIADTNQIVADAPSKTIGESQYEVIMEENSPMTELNVPLSIPQDSQVFLNFSYLLDSNHSTTISNELVLKRETPDYNYSLIIPVGTKIVGDANWNGTINVPTVKPASSVTVTPDSGNTASTVTVLEIGFGDTNITFDKAARILISGQAGNYVGYSKNGEFHKITTICASDTQTNGNALLDGGDCKMDVNSDLVIWTKHFTLFVTYTQAVIPIIIPNPDSSGGYSGGGGYSTSGAGNSITTQTTKTQTTTDNNVSVNQKNDSSTNNKPIDNNNAINEGTTQAKENAMIGPETTSNESQLSPATGLFGLGDVGGLPIVVIGIIALVLVAVGTLYFFKRK